MADQKISQLTDGGASQATDEYVIARSGSNFRIDGASVAAAATSVGTLTALNVSGTTNLAALTASRAVFTDGSKNLVSNAITGTGNVVMSASPTFTGTATMATVAATTITEGGSNVVVQTDIGSAANEVPLNQYLGTMAFQDAAFATVGQLQRSYVVLADNTAAQALGTNFATQVGISADTTLTTTVPPAGTNATVVIVSVGASSRTVTFGTGFASTGTLATGTTADRRFVLTFISDGTRLLEVSRTTAITV